MGDLVRGGKPKQTGPSAEELAAQQRLEAQQKAEQQKREQLRIALARQRLGGAGAAAASQGNNGSFLG